MASLSAAHPTMPLPSYARVTNLENGYSIVVRVNDRGPYSGGRVMDVSSRVADVLDIKGAGTGRIKVEYVGPAPLEGSDDSTLLASLRTDGSPANLNGYSAPVMVASRAWTPQPEPQPEPVRLAGRGAAPLLAPEPAPVRTASRAAPPPEPIRVAAAEPVPAPAAPRDPAPAAVALRHPHFPVPLPPPRPFDLGAIRSAALVASATAPRPALAVMPPRRPDLQASAEKALYFSDAAFGRPRPRAPRAFDGLKPAKAPLIDD